MPWSLFRKKLHFFSLDSYWTHTSKDFAATVLILNRIEVQGSHTLWFIGLYVRGSVIPVSLSKSKRNKNKVPLFALYIRFFSSFNIKTIFNGKYHVFFFFVIFSLPTSNSDLWCGTSCWSSLLAAPNIPALEPDNNNSVCRSCEREWQLSSESIQHLCLPRAPSV